MSQDTAGEASGNSPGAGALGLGTRQDNVSSCIARTRQDALVSVAFWLKSGSPGGTPPAVASIHVASLYENTVS